MKKILLFVSVLLTAIQMQAQEGTLDPTFGNNGYKTLTSDLAIFAFAPDGKLVGAKKSGNGFVIYRYETLQGR